MSRKVKKSSLYERIWRKKVEIRKAIIQYHKHFLREAMDQYKLHKMPTKAEFYPLASSTFIDPPTESSSVCTWSIYDDTDLCLEDSYMRDVHSSRGSREEKMESRRVLPRSSTRIHLHGNDQRVPDGHDSDDILMFHPSSRRPWIPGGEDLESDNAQIVPSSTRRPEVPGKISRRPEVPGQESSPSSRNARCEPQSHLRKSKGSTDLLIHTKNYSKTERHAVLKKMKKFNKEFMNSEQRSSVVTLTTL